MALQKNSVSKTLTSGNGLLLALVVFVLELVPSMGFRVYKGFGFRVLGFGGLGL